MKRSVLLWIGAVVLAVAGASIAQAGDAKNGEAVFSRCVACHTATKGGASGLGPNLFGVVGRKAGSLAGFSYSAAMKGAGFAWSNARLDAYIDDPAKTVPGNRMAFAGLHDAKQRGDVIAYLDTLK